ncbi:MAG: hypothetical protein VKK42_08830 [Lyngbya sp.]|nr:hypothetical protein [Lyngbya sp.]
MGWRVNPFGLPLQWRVSVSRVRVLAIRNDKCWISPQLPFLHGHFYTIGLNLGCIANGNIAYFYPIA